MPKLKKTRRPPTASGSRQKKISKSKTELATPVRRSKRLIEKDLIDPGQRSPGRRCSPLHRLSFPSRSLLKLDGKMDHEVGNVAFLRPGFYSADDLQTFLELRSNSALSSPTAQSGGDLNGLEQQQVELEQNGQDGIPKHLPLPSPSSPLPMQLLAAKSPPSRKTVVWSDKLEW
jgi:hypothetical protein